MSFIFLAGFFMFLNGTLDIALDTEYLIVWALFSIADALWIRRFR